MLVEEEEEEEEEEERSRRGAICKSDGTQDPKSIYKPMCFLG